MENQVALCTYVKQILEKGMLKYSEQGSSTLPIKRQDDTNHQINKINSVSQKCPIHSLRYQEPCMHHHFKDYKNILL